MINEIARKKRRIFVLINYFFLLVMNVSFYFVYDNRDVSHLIDASGIGALIIVVFTFINVHKKSGLWKLTHTKTDFLDERQMQVTHNALSRSYSIFTVTCLAIMLVNGVLYRLVPGLDPVITLPLVASLIFLAHTLPASILAWTEIEVPGDLK